MCWWRDCDGLQCRSRQLAPAILMTCMSQLLTLHVTTDSVSTPYDISISIMSPRTPPPHSAGYWLLLLLLQLMMTTNRRLTIN